MLECPFLAQIYGIHLNKSEMKFFSVTFIRLLLFYGFKNFVIHILNQLVLYRVYSERKHLGGRYMKRNDIKN